LALVLWAFGPDALSQLAITEVMSNGSTAGLDFGFQRPDFWELTNFGTNDVDLTGYRWMDGDGNGFADGLEMLPVTIRTNESIIFVKDSVAIPNAAAFREWWGFNLPTNLQIHFWGPRPGFDQDKGDAVRLWDAAGRLVDEVRFGPGSPGVTITYDPVTGEFSKFSPDVEEVFSSTEGADIGSPGKAPRGPVPLRITQQPVTQIPVDAGSEVVLRVQATGRPAPRYQWYSNSVPIPSAVVTSSVPRLVCYANCGPSWERPPGPNDFTFSEIRPEHGGNYFVEVFNGLTRLTSAVITITVNTNPSPIQVDCPSAPSCQPGIGADPITLVANPGQTAIFTVETRGYPLPTFQWSSSTDGVTFTDLNGATNRQLTLTDITNSHAGHYRVRMQNSLGTTTAVARLSVQPPPQLAITEVMALDCTTANRDWWELTNIGEEPVNLCGYRWDDGTDTFSIGGGPTITNDVIVQPGESVILLESQTAEEFIQWWGAANLPPNLKFVTYAANGLDNEAGDSIRLWPPNETENSRWIAVADFSTPLAGFSLWWDLPRCRNVDKFGNIVGENGTLSVIGQCNAFQAEQGCEIGSPGWTRWTRPILTSVIRKGSLCTLSWKAQPGSTNRLQFARQLALPPEATIWEDLGDYRCEVFNCAVDDLLGPDAQRFYRVLQVSTADCPCPDL
jgi:hypothetical protein